MSEWRPEGWKNPYPPSDFYGRYDDYENGADAMLETLKSSQYAAKAIPNSQQMVISTKRMAKNADEFDSPVIIGFIPELKGTWVFIPDEAQP
jgi:hypothetical protein